MLSGGVLDTGGLDGDVQELFRYNDDGTVEVHRWINDVRWNACPGLATVCRDGELEKEDMPSWTRKAIARIWQRVLEDVEASNTFTKSIVWKSGNFLRHVVSEKEGREAITFTYVCAHCKLFPGGDVLWVVRTNHGENAKRKQTQEGGVWSMRNAI